MEIVSGNDFVEAFLTSISSLLYDDAEIFLNKLSNTVRSLDIDDSNKMVTLLFNKVSETNDSKMFVLIYEYLQNMMYGGENDDYPFYLNLFTDTTIIKDSHLLMIRTLKLDFVNVMLKLATTESNDTLLTTARTVYRAFGGNLPLSELRAIDKIVSQETGSGEPYSESISDFLEIYIKLKSPFKGTPPWIDLSTKGKKHEKLMLLIDDDPEIVFNEETRKVNIETVMNYIKVPEENKEFVRNDLLEYLETAPLDEIKDFIESKVGNIMSAELLKADAVQSLARFKVLGPFNPYKDPEKSDLLDMHMFKHRDRWWKGSCDFCFMRIGSASSKTDINGDEIGKNKWWYAIRRPNLDGDWSGCYCSLLCAHDQIDDLEKKFDIPNAPEMHMKLDLYYDQFKRNGIFERKL